MSVGRRKATIVVLVAAAALVVVALGIVTVVTVVRGHQTMMAGASGHMMGGPMMHGSSTGGGESSPTIPAAREITVASTAFRFDPAEIHVRAGEDVTIVLTAGDMTHDFTIYGLGFHIVAAPGQDGRGSFHAPSTPGRYDAYCSIPGHRQAGMTATVVVDPA